MGSRNRQLAAIITDSSGDIKTDAFDNLIQTSVEPEDLNFAVDVRGAGHEAPWLWSWNPTTLPYERTKITLSNEGEVPIYKKGDYRLDNYAAYNTNGTSSQVHKIFLKWIEEPGTANLVDWVTYDSSNTVEFAGVTDGLGAQKTQRLTWTIPESFDIPTLNTSTTNYNVGAVTGAYVHSGIAMGNNVDIGPLRRGNTYNFILDSTTSGHPFYLTTDSQGEFSAGTYGGEYTTGVTNSRAQGSSGTDATVTFVVPDDAPDTLYYQCGNHQVMGGEITIKDLAVEYTDDNEPILYFQHSQEGHFTQAPVRAVPTIPGQMCLTFDPTKGKFVPQDLRDYMEKTPTFVSRIVEEIKDNSIDSDRHLGILRAKTIINDSDIFTGGTGGVDSAETTRLIDSDYIATRALAENHTTLMQDGTLTVTTGTARWYAPRAVKIIGMKAHVSTAPAGSAVNIRVNKNGSSLRTLVINAGSTSANLGGIADDLSAGDYLTVDVTQVGSSTAGSDLALIIRYR